MTSHNDDGRGSVQDPYVSVIIPCYNYGQYIGEAIQSVLDQSYPRYEIVIVDDGSTDEQTIRILKRLDHPRVRVIRMVHQGLAGARNEGIRDAQGKYILPLDADDKINPTYLEQAVHSIEANDNLGIVYCKAELFGEQSGTWELPPCHFPEMLYGNVIFCSALFRRSDWEQVNGYNSNMLYGWEDYDFWLSLIELGREVFCIPETLFYYRKHSDSLVAKMRAEHVLYSYAQLFRNHPKLYADNIGTLLMNHQSLVHDFEQQCRQKDEHISSLEAAVQDQNHLISELLSSLSWKITTPLRYAMAVVRRHARKRSM